MRDEGFDYSDVASQMAADEGFGTSPGTLVQLNSTHVPSKTKCNLGGLFSGWSEPFVGVDTFPKGEVLPNLYPKGEVLPNLYPQMEYSTSVNKVDRKIDKQIYDNLTTQGMTRMSPDSKYTPYHCPNGLMQ
jgi:hypothetical protein